MNYKTIFMLAIMVLSTSLAFAAEVKLRDPTKPPSFAIPKAGKAEVTNFKLSEIRIADDERQVVINGKRLRKGNSIAGYRVKNIEVGYVILENDKGTLRLNLIASRIIRKIL